MRSRTWQDQWSAGRLGENREYDRRGGERNKTLRDLTTFPATVKRIIGPESGNIILDRATFHRVRFFVGGFDDINEFVITI